MRLITYFIYLLFITGILFAQENDIQRLREKYVSFQYEEVIEFADNMLRNNDYGKDQLIQIYEMLGIAHYSLGNEEKARTAFRNVLEKDINYSMDPEQVSPKIISFFDDVKESFQTELDQEKPILDSLRIFKQQTAATQSNYQNAVIKNLLIPGWGQFQMDNSAKGIIYSILAVTSTAASIYYIFDTADKESAYLNETDRTLIPGKYDEYNSSYKLRNLSITATALIWITSQIDILFFTDINKNFQISTSPRYNPASEIEFNLSFPLN